MSIFRPIKVILYQRQPLVLEAKSLKDGMSQDPTQTNKCNALKNSNNLVYFIFHVHHCILLMRHCTYPLVLLKTAFVVEKEMRSCQVDLKSYKILVLHKKVHA